MDFDFFREPTHLQGMKVRRNRLTWKVPSNHKPGPVSVILTLTDASGPEVFHSYTL